MTIQSFRTHLGYKAEIKVRERNPLQTTGFLLNQSRLSGFSIMNNTDTELFAYVICFSTEDISISWYNLPLMVLRF